MEMGVLQYSEVVRVRFSYIVEILFVAVDVIGVFFDKERGEWCWKMQFLMLLRALPLSLPPLSLSLTLSAISVCLSVVYPPGGGRPVQVEDI